MQRWASFAPSLTSTLYSGSAPQNIEFFSLLPFVTGLTSESYCYIPASLKQSEGERGASEAVFTELLKQTQKNGSWTGGGKHAVGSVGEERECQSSSSSRKMIFHVRMQRMLEELTQSPWSMRLLRFLLLKIMLFSFYRALNPVSPVVNKLILPSYISSHWQKNRVEFVYTSFYWCPNSFLRVFCPVFGWTVIWVLVTLQFLFYWTCFKQLHVNLMNTAKNDLFATACSYLR